MQVGWCCVPARAWVRVQGPEHCCWEAAPDPAVLVQAMALTPAHHAPGPPAPLLQAAQRLCKHGTDMPILHAECR